MKISTVLKLAAASFFFASPALAQTPGAVTNHAFVIGKGPGQTGYTSLLCGSAQLAVGQSAADPICRTLTGDVTITAGGVTEIGAGKVTSAMLNADVFSTAHSWSGQQTFTAPILGTPASGTLTNTTGFPVANLAGAGTGVLTFLATPSSANLRAALTDEVGTGAAYFVGGALGTPASGTLTNATGLPLSGLTAQAAYTFIGNNTGSSAIPTAVDIPGLTTKAAPAAGDYVMLSDQAASGAWKKATVASVASAGSVSSIAGNTGAFTLGYGLTNSTNDLRASLTSVTNSLAGDAALNSTGAYTTGPTTAQGTSGTWLATGTVTILNANADTYAAKLWDGTTVIASTIATIGVNARYSIALSGVIASPAGNIRISVIPISTTSGNIKASDSGNGKDSTLTVVRIAP